MPTEKQASLDPSQKQHLLAQLHAVIAEQVVHRLETSPDLYRVQVRTLWDDHYRVNVFVRSDDICVKVAYSYFLVTDGQGKILASSPAIAGRAQSG